MIKSLYLLALAVSISLAADVIDPETCTSFPCLIFEDEFDFLDHSVWGHEITMSGGGNFEFQTYVNNRSISYTRDSLLFIKPDLMSNWKGDEFIYGGDLDLWGMNGDGDVCTSALFDGCRQHGDLEQILTPTVSARLRTLDDFNFKYGRVEVVAKMPKGDWLWPAIWMLPWRFPYGFWPASGEIDIIESRGNAEFGDNNELTYNTIGTTLHWAPYSELNAYSLTHVEFPPPSGAGFADDFYTFALEWTDQDIKMYCNGELQYTIDPGTSFYDFGGFAAAGSDNPWVGRGKMAPFDQKFYLILNVAVGGTGGFFPDGVASNPPKPWQDTSPTAMREFWDARDQWYPTWTQGLDGETSENSALQIDSIRVYKMSADQV